MAEPKPLKQIAPGNPPVPTNPRKQIVIGRSAPTVSRMLEDAYQTLSMQLHQFRQRAHCGPFGVSEATSFSKLVGALSTLQQAEVRHEEKLNLGEVPEAQLRSLAAQAERILASGDEGKSER